MSKTKDEKKKKTAQSEEASPAEQAAQPASECEATSAPESAGAPDAPDGDAQTAFDELNDRYLRLCAEYDNFRKRTLKERDAAHDSTVAHTVSQLLPVYDNLERAATAQTTDEAYKKGVLMTMTMLDECLQKLGVTVIEAERGMDFDPNRHEAMMHIDDPELGENQIAQIFQKGFQVGEKVIRHSVVQVAN